MGHRNEFSLGENGVPRRDARNGLSLVAGLHKASAAALKERLERRFCHGQDFARRVRGDLSPAAVSEDGRRRV